MKQLRNKVHDLNGRDQKDRGDTISHTIQYATVNANVDSALQGWIEHAFIHITTTLIRRKSY